MKRIHYNLIITSIILLAGCEQMAGYAVQLTQDAPPVIDEPVIDDPIIDDPVIDDPVIDDPVIDDPVIDDPVIDDPVIDDPVIDDPVIDDPIIDDPVIDDPVIDDPVIDDPDIPEYVEITEEECSSATFDEICKDNVMIYCGGAGIEHLIYVDCSRMYNNPDNPGKCVRFNVNNRITAVCTHQMEEGSSCTKDNDGEMYSSCDYLDFEYTGKDQYYAYATTICSIGDDGIYRWHYQYYNLCSDSCSSLTGCTLEPCTELGATRCASDHNLLICTQFEDGYYYAHKSVSCDN